MTVATARDIRGDTKTVHVTVYFFKPGWGVTQSAPGEAYVFECLGVVSSSKTRTYYTLHGAFTEKLWPNWWARGKHAATPLVEPLRQALQTVLGMDVQPFYGNIIADGSPEIVSEENDNDD